MQRLHLLRLLLSMWRGHDGRRRNTSPIVRSGWSGEVGFELFLVEMLVGSVWDFGNEGVVFDEGVIGEQLSATDAEPDVRQRNPVVQFLDNASVVSSK
jgi:hypothetical protein